MAAQIAHDVVNDTQSMGAPSSIDDIAQPTTLASADSGHQISTYSQTNPNDSAHISTNQPGDESLRFVDSEVTALSRDPAKSPLSEKALLAEASGGSDTDTSKPDTAPKDEALGHARSNSVKKPISFKSVSVTKNFLAKAAVSTPTSRPGDKAPSSNQPTPASSAAKPRLVAKSALGGLGSRSGIRGTSSSAGPDASQVWNKNRPAPPAAPRTFTDEELKQQYGIHMATRLGPADEADKESKWADIDDDEDDWAPETVTWLDGTKSTVAQPELKPPQPQHIDEPKQEEVSPPPLPKLGAPAQPPVSLSAKTILKPGSHSLSQTKPSGGLVLKGAPEKIGASAATSTATAPAKSPWAPLPPVDKVSPVHFVPPVQPPPQRFSRDPTGFDGFQTAPSPKEIEADDFNRVYDQPRNRELYNSQSGRFEPAAEMRKGQGRHEHGYRQPAVLQRPTYGQQSAPEPSPAFQTNRSGMESPHWSRHRAGSTSSTGRRMSIGRPQDVPNEKINTSGIVSALSDHQQTPVLTNAQLDAPQAQEIANASEPDASQAPLEPQEDPVAQQQRLMREKIELAKQAKQRRIEEEEREEKARKERLRLKVAALAAATPSPPAEPKDKQMENHVHASGKSPQTQKPALIASPPKPPIPTAEGEIAQYGMMKVHQPHPVKKTNVTESSLIGRTIMDSHVERRHIHSENITQRTDQSSRLPSTSEKTQASGTDQKRSGALPETSLWRTGGAPEGYAVWGSSSSNNVWGPPQSKDRALGNGTFDTAGYRITQSGLPASRPLAHSNPASFGAPGPIAPPVTQAQSQSSLATQRTPHERASGFEVATGECGLDLEVSEGAVAPGLPSHEASSFSHHLAPQQPRHGHFVDHQNLNSMPSMPTKTGPHGYQRNSAFKNNTGLDDMVEQRRHESEVTAKWNAVTENSMRQNEELRKQHEDRLRRIQEQGGRTALAIRSGQDHPAIGESSGINGIGVPQQPGHPAQSKVIAPIGQSANAPASQRASRFFPRAAGTQETSDKSDSPPPPEQSSLDSGHARVVVNIPKVPIVKLPPPQLPSTPRVNSAVLLSSPAQKSAEQPSGWQDRINLLLKRQKPGVALNTSSRSPLAVSSSPSATVSLPAAAKLRRRPLFSNDASPDPQSKSTEEDLYPQPEFGSTPTIHLPPRGQVHEKETRPPALFKSQNAVITRQIKELERDFGQSISLVEVKQLFDSTNPKGEIVVIKLQHMAVPKTVVLPNSSPRPHNPRSTSSSYRGRRGQDSSYTSNRGNRRASTQQSTPSDPLSPTSRGPSGRGGFGRGGTPRPGSSRGSFRQQNSNGHIAKRNITAPVQRAA